MGPLVLALDLSHLVGWACGRAGAEPDHGVVHLPSGIRGIGASMAALIDALADLHAVQHFERVIVEAPIARHRGQQAARMQLGLAAGVELWCWRREIPCHEAAATTVRARVLGNGHARKPDVVAWCLQRGWHPADDNAADALALLAYAHEVGRMRAAA